MDTLDFKSVYIVNSFPHLILSFCCSELLHCARAAQCGDLLPVVPTDGEWTEEDSTLSEGQDNAQSEGQDGGHLDAQDSGHLDIQDSGV
jgi:hypothetical protein